MTAPAPAVRCVGLTVGYGGGAVLRELSFEVASGEAFALLGPSGSGKTTLLSTIAGFLQPDAGEVHIAGRLVATHRRSLSPEARRVGVVFQHNALWPHLSALDTVAYPLRRRRVALDAARRQAAGLLELMGLADLAGRRPDQLSGGQQQRVGLARALAADADLLLFDEPTAHLDAPLRAALQAEIDERRRAAGTAALYATHDAAEALAIADRLAILRDGRVLQSGTPADVYDHPVDLWAARLTGPAAVIRAPAVGVSGDTIAVTVGHTTIRVASDAPVSSRSELLVRPGWATLNGPLPGTVDRVWYRGPHTDYRLASPVGEVVCRRPGPPVLRPGERASWTLSRVWPLEAASAPASTGSAGDPEVTHREHNARDGQRGRFRRS